jgi:hypothetical protein
MFKAHLVNGNGIEASEHPRRLLKHPLGMSDIRVKKRIEATEAGQTTIPVWEVSMERRLFRNLRWTMLCSQYSVQSLPVPGSVERKDC